MTGPVELAERAAEDSAIRFLLDGLGVATLRDLHVYVEAGRRYLEAQPDEMLVTQIEDLWSEPPLALLLDGPSRGKLVPVSGPYEIHVEDGVEYQVVPRGSDDWKFPIHYRRAEEPDRW